MATTYLTEPQMDQLIIQVQRLRKGHKLNSLRKRYTVIVDDAHHYFRSTTTLRKFLNSCVFPENFRIFRNFDKGVSINLD
jgi:hypothetical protein